MPFYLDTYVGDALAVDGFRPSAFDLIVDGGSLNLSPGRQTVVGARAVVWTPEALAVSPGRLKLAELATEVLSASTRSSLGNRLGLNLAGSSLADVLVELLVVHARQDGTRWRPLQAAPAVDASGRGMLVYEVRLGPAGLVARRLAASDGPGAGLAESWNAANSAGLTADLTWTETSAVADWNLDANSARLNASAGVSAAADARAESDLATADQVVAADVTWDNLNTLVAGTAARFSASARDYYLGGATGANDADRIFKVVGGTQTQIATQAHTINTGDTLHVTTRALGSAIDVTVGAASLLSVTDTAITGNRRAGIGATRSTAAVTAHIDNWTAADYYQRENRVARMAGEGVRAVHRAARW